MNARKLYFQLQYPIVRRMLEATKRGAEVQREVMLQKLRLVAGSRFAADHATEAIRSPEEFRERLPIADFEHFRPYIDRVSVKETTALFAPGTKVHMFALTSGTTDQPKRIPVTDDFIRNYKRGWKIWGLQTHADHRRLFHKTYLHLASDWQQERTSGGIWCGNISGLAAETRPAVVRRPFLIPPEVSKLRHWTNRQYTILRLALASSRLGMIITANPLTLVKLAELLQAKSETLLRDLHDGTCSLPEPEEPPLPAALVKRLRKRQVARGQQLQQILEQHGRLTPREVWPEIDVAAVWMGGPVGTLVPRVRELYGPQACRDHGLSASEGRMTIPMQDEANCGLLDFTSNYFEFIPESEAESRQPTVLEAHELEVDQKYSILLTNSAGLFRYKINDIVQCAGFEGQVPLLRFLHKGAHCVNLVGEKLTEDQVVRAVQQSFRDLSQDPELVILAPQLGERSFYKLLVEESLADHAPRLADLLDQHLARLNCEYDDRLKTRRLGAIVCQTIPNGSWERLRDLKIELRGGSQEQYKHAFLATSDDILKTLCESQRSS